MLGDRAFNYNPVLACFDFSQEHVLPFLTIILNNPSYRSRQRSLDRAYPGGHGEQYGPQSATSIKPCPDHPQLVEAFGGWGVAGDSPDEIGSAIKRAIREVEAGRPALVDILLAT
jgi:thiamine pyrophosphate-dependent acetolactate synthase large subunit-like protein